MSSQISPSEQRLVHTMQLLGDSTRFSIFKLLTDDRELCVSEIAGTLNISPSAVSQHFKHFEMLGLVNKARHGQRICYSLKQDDTLIEQLKTLREEQYI